MIFCLINFSVFTFSPLDILTTSSTYFQVSEPKAKLMTRYSREMTLINGDCCDLTKKKVSFLFSIVDFNTKSIYSSVN